MTAPSVAIHGSCVTRDAFTETSESAFTVETYVARHSVVSAVAEPLRHSALADDDLGARPWRTRMGRCDAEKELFTQLAASQADVLVIDFMDERIALAGTSGTLVTLSDELHEYLALVGYAGDLTPLSVRSTYRPGFWTGALDVYAEAVRGAFPAGRIVIHESYQTPCYRSASGQIRLFPARTLVHVVGTNLMLALKYRRLRKQLPEATRIRMPLRTLADERHRWGLEPHHYTPGYYKKFLQRLEAATRSLQRPQPTPLE